MCWIQEKFALPRLLARLPTPAIPLRLLGGVP